MSSESCFEKLEQLITDENRIVTYKILSREMKIHVNKAKEYLNLFYENKKADQNAGLFAHYFLSGLIKNEDMEVLKVLIIPEDKLRESKEAFQKLTSFHIYSVSRMKLKDECALYTTEMSYNRNSEELKKFSAIKHPTIKIQSPTFKVDFAKTDVKSNGAKSKNIGLDNGNLTPVPQKIENKNDKVQLNGVSNEKVNSGSESTTSSNTKKKGTPENSKQNSLASLWQKKEETKNVEKKVSKPDDKAKKGAAKSVGKNSIINMFSKQAEKNVGKKIDSPPSVKEEIKSPRVEVVEKSSSTSIKKSESQTTKTSQKRKTSKRQQNKKAKHQSDDDSEEEMQRKKKKHRRICTFEDSDSESENEEMQDKTQRNFLNSPDEIFPSTVASDDSEEPIPPTPPVHKTVKVKGKVWKTVQKTYQDDDGFFVTKKEKELVSASEDSDEDPLKPIPKEEPSKNSPSKTACAAKKQASLTSFFKRK